MVNKLYHLLRVENDIMWISVVIKEMEKYSNEQKNTFENEDLSLKVYNLNEVIKISQFHVFLLVNLLKKSIPKKWKKILNLTLNEKKFQVIKKFETDRKKQLLLIKKFDVIVVKSVVRVDKKFIDNATKLKVIARAGTGLDNIDIKYCKKKKIKVINTPSLNSNAVADFTVMQILCLVRNAYKAQTMVKNNDFRRDLLLGRDMRNLKVGIVGFGNVGKKVAKRLIPFGSTIYVLEKKIKVNKKYKRAKSLNELIKIVDV